MIDQGEHQLPLFDVSPTLPPEVAERLEEPDRPGNAPEHTAARFFRDRPDDAQRVIGLLAEDISPRRIAKALGVGVGTIYAVRARARPELEHQKKNLARRSLDAAESALDALMTAVNDPARVAKTPIKDLSITFGVLTDKGVGLQSELPPDFDPAGGEPGHDRMIREIAAMGLAAGIGAQIGAAAARSVAAAERIPRPPAADDGPGGRRPPIDVGGLDGDL